MQKKQITSNHKIAAVLIFLSPLSFRLAFCLALRREGTLKKGSRKGLVLQFGRFFGEGGFAPSPNLSPTKGAKAPLESLIFNSKGMDPLPPAKDHSLAPQHRISKVFICLGLDHLHQDA